MLAEFSDITALSYTFSLPFVKELIQMCANRGLCLSTIP